MKKILIVIPTLSGGGAERFVSILSNYLIKKEYDIKILMFEEMEPYYDFDSKINIKTSGCIVNRKNKIISKLQLVYNIFYKIIKSIKKELKEYNPDIVVSFLPQADLSLYLSMKKNKNFKLICSERNDPKERNILLRAFLRKVYKKADYLVCQSSVVANYYNNIKKENKIIIPNPVDPSIIPEFQRYETSLRIVSAGRLDFQKNFSLLINSFADICNKLPKGANLTIYGEGRERKLLEKLIEDKKLNNKVFLPGQSKTLLEDIKGAALFVMSSDFEGFPNALLEAMVVGLPVITTDFSTGTARILVGNNNGIIVPTRNKIELSKAMFHLMNDKKKRDFMRLNNRKLLKKYSIEQILKLWEQLFI